MLRSCCSAPTGGCSIVRSRLRAATARHTSGLNGFGPRCLTSLARCRLRSCLWRPETICALLNTGETAAKWVNKRMPPLLRFGVSAAGSDPAAPTGHYVGPLLLVIVFFASALIFVCGPNSVAEWLPRALIVPVGLGGGVAVVNRPSAARRTARGS